ncbi:hypothetical protein BDY24DRAFT_401534 [Mrakia frigida]|uniref:uncharacterized protein n=1 Tax=Mrakia frigida TaxID=29902 RepID=UPI003FCC16EC
MRSFVLRTSIPSSVSITVRTSTLPSVTTNSVRSMSTGNEGAVASDREWSKREQAAEGRYAREQEVKELKHLRAKIERQEKDLEVDLKAATEVLDESILEKEKEIKKPDEKKP